VSEGKRLQAREWAVQTGGAVLAFQVSIGFGSALVLLGFTMLLRLKRWHAKNPITCLSGARSLTMNSATKP
jgi:hypothetical protein